MLEPRNHDMVNLNSGARSSFKTNLFGDWNLKTRVLHKCNFVVVSPGTGPIVFEFRFEAA
jgi:hypothetical protein